ncbi:MAG TPA: Zn-dependent hydrolase [Roseiarcus sp.]|jgi:N-carbamoyl-L-amino-acid hydrolase|nr:Zn-dependent hydrolase [Roseiarcus sp.]
MSSKLAVDPDRLWDDIMALAAITDPERPYTRRSFSALFLKGREWLARRFGEAGLDVRIDTAGNLIGLCEGAEPGLKTIMLGSHSDTVPSGGRFDGIAGVIAALEIARSLKNAGIVLRHPLEVVDFLAEEPSEYGLSCVGSRGMVGALDADMLALKGPNGEPLASALRRVGGDPDKLAESKRENIDAFLELHIEQGVVLESEGIDVGLVTSIVGIRRIEIAFEGEADHAGTTPMDLRRDALVAAARTVDSVRRAAEALAAEGGHYFVATVGILDVSPSASNVVPSRCRLIIDARSTSPEMARRFAERIDPESADHARKARVRRTGFTVLSDGPPAACDPGLRAELSHAALRLGLTARELASGAGHDAAFMTRICPAAMIFTPCRAGKSHTPEEWADRDALAAGGSVMFETVRSLDRAG